MSKSVTKKQIDELWENSDITVMSVFDKCTVVAVKLPNGFVLVESSACVDPANYSREIGFDICKTKLINRIWELEGYLLQNETEVTNE